jgi:hypothetical protein
MATRAGACAPDPQPSFRYARIKGCFLNLTGGCNGVWMAALIL